MAIKTKEEMFGDGGGFGAAVPFSTSNPAGHGAGNRGIAFGESVTSAIANRSHYALALNDEDLNDRLAEFETDGLDAAYRLGLVATPGGGRQITLDGGAIETISALATEYEDDIANAHFRADARADSTRGSTGFEFVSDNDPTDVVSGTGWAGFIDRRALGIQAAGFSSVFDAAEPALLNPSGAGGNIVRLTTGGKAFYTTEAGPTPPAGNYTSLRLGVDLIEISGDVDGLFIITGLGPTEADVTVRTLNGATPSFSSSAAATVTVHRIRLGSIGTEFSGTRIDLQGTVLSSPKGGGAALDLYGGGEAVTAVALRVRYATEFGAPATALSIDEFGRQTFSILSEDLRYDYINARRPVHAGGGAFATKVLREGSAGGGGEFGHLVTGGDLTVRGRHDFVSLVPFAPTGVTNLDLSIPFGFIAASPTDGRLDLSSASLAASAWLHMLEYGMFVEIVTGGGDTAGYYVLTTRNPGSTYIEVRELNHELPAHFPTSGSGTLRFHAASRLGASEQTLVNGVEGMPEGARTQATLYNVMVGGPEADSVALAIFTPGNPLGTENRGAISVFKNEATFQPLEIFSVQPGGTGENGYVETYNILAHEGIFISNTPFADAELLYGVPGTPEARERTIKIDLGDIVSEDGGTSLKWEVVGGSGLSAHYIRSLVNSGYGYIPINKVLRTGMDITGLVMRCNLNGSTHSTFGDRFFCGVYYVAGTLAMSAAATPAVIGSIDDNETVGWQTFDPGSTIGGGAHTVDLSLRNYYIYVKASVDGAANADEVHTIDLIVDDPGPRNF